VCWCRVSEHSGDWDGGIYHFGTDQELFDRATLDIRVEDAKVAAYIADRKAKERLLDGTQSKDSDRGNKDITSDTGSHERST
jgi:hypothetical protein